MHEIHTSQFDLNLIKVFIAIYETQSVSVAAKGLDLTQSATSHVLKRLRAALGDPLFVRTTHGMQPTPYAEQLATAIGRPLAELYLGMSIGRSFDPLTSTRTFKLYLSSVGQLVVLPKLHAFLSKNAPFSKVQVITGPQVSLEGALEQGNVDLAIGYLSTLAPGFFKKRLFKEHYVCVARKDHPMFRDGMSVNGFESVQHVLADSTGMSHETLEKTLSHLGLRRQVQLRVPEFMVLPFVVQESDLLCIMPSRLANQLSKLVPLKLMPLPIPIGAYDINVYWHSRYNADSTNIWLRRSIATLFSEA